MDKVLAFLFCFAGGRGEQEEGYILSLQATTVVSRFYRSLYWDAKQRVSGHTRTSPQIRAVTRYFHCQTFLS